jgi:hypothetical protein
MWNQCFVQASSSSSSSFRRCDGHQGCWLTSD